MHEKLYVNFQELKRIYLINIKKILLFTLFASAAALKRTSLQADRSLITSSVTLNDAVKRDSSPPGHAVCKRRYATHASVLWVRMGQQVTDVCIFVQEKKITFQKIPKKISLNGKRKKALSIHSK